MPPNPDFTSEFEGGTTCRSRPCANPCMPQPPTMGNLFRVALVSDGSKWYSSPSWTAPRSHSSVEVAQAMSRHMRAFIGASFYPSCFLLLNPGPQDSDPKIILRWHRNYTGNILNFGLAVEQYTVEHTEKSDKVKFLVVGDDVAVGKTQGRIVGRSSCLGLTRAEGLGVVLVYKIAGALAAEGATLDEVHSIAQSPAWPCLCLPSRPPKLRIGLGGIVHAVREELHKHQISMSRVLAGMFMSQHARLLPLAAPPPARGQSCPQAEPPILSLLDASGQTPGWKWASGTPPVMPTPLAPLATAAKKGGSASGIGAPQPAYFLAALQRVCTAVVAAELEITRMDTIAGNGDCGLEEIKLRNSSVFHPCERRFLYALFLTLDANFRMKRKDVSSEADDPSLGDRIVFFSHVDEYMAHLDKHWDVEQEKSTCVAHDAVDEPDREPFGMASSGIGTVDCAWHNMKRPNGWHKNIWSRLAKYGPELRGHGRNRHYVWLIPKFHLPAHIEACNILFSFNLTPYVGQTDSEAPERGWVNANPLATSTKEMGPGAQRDALDDHFNDWNHKIIGLGKFLLERAQKAIPNMSDFRLALVEAEQGLPEADLERWTKEMELWEDEPVNPNPFKVAERPKDIFAIRKQLAKDAEGARVGDAAADVRGDLHAHKMIDMGMHLEEQQRALQWDSGAVKLHATDCQKTALLECSNKLGRKITKWLKIRELFGPIVVPLRMADDQARATAARLQATPVLPVHTIKLWLPSRLASMPSVTVKESHACMEFALWIGKAKTALGELCRLLLYRAACAALAYLGPILKETEWKLKLQTLAPDDVRARPHAIFSDPEHKSRKKKKKRLEGAWRWTEEVDLLEQEMDRVLRFLRWKEAWWMDIQDQRPSVVEDPILSEEFTAYARRQSEIQHHLRLRFEGNWRDILRLTQITREGLGVIPVETQHGEGDEQDKDEDEDENEPIPEAPRDMPRGRAYPLRPGPKRQGYSPAPTTVKSAPGAALPAAPGPKNGGATRPPPPPLKAPPGRPYPLRPGPKQRDHSPTPAPDAPQSKAPRGRPYQLCPGPKTARPLARPRPQSKAPRPKGRFHPSAPPQLAGGLENAGRAHLDHPWRLPCLLDRKPAPPRGVTTLHLSLLPGTFWLTLLSLPKLFGALSGLPAFIWSFVAAPLVSLPVPDHKMAAIRQTLLTTARLTRTGHITDRNHFQKYDCLHAAFFAKRNRLGYSGDGPGLIYIVASFKKADDVALGPDTMCFLAQLNIKGGLTQPDRMECRRTEYRKCEEDNAHVWICTYKVSRQHLLHLTLLRDGVTRDRTPCKCGVSHRKYFNFLSIGGLSRLHVTTVSVLKLMGEPIRRKFFLPSDDTKAVYDLIRAT
ncbi:hypothetical protein DFH08DRAFT_798338 [Mycena albidolilacea]|uniref:DhaK domain-containing protein n=1 Tax=Mycena albidolilacea TaxID=1033008 RepID=A0AAD7AN47_9AGAR|nr:hypothetical protein DFH08DRAFT_798338 [Mycena albidolilacea]